jgi:hypothetical protein
LRVASLLKPGVIPDRSLFLGVGRWHQVDEAHRDWLVAESGRLVRVQAGPAVVFGECLDRDSRLC